MQDRQSKAAARPETGPQQPSTPSPPSTADTLAAVEAVLPPGHVSPDPTRPTLGDPANPSRPTLGDMRARGLSKRLGLSVKVAEGEGDPVALPAGPQLAQVSLWALLSELPVLAGLVCMSGKCV